MNIKIIDNGFDYQAGLLKRSIAERIPVIFSEEGICIELEVNDTLGPIESYMICEEETGWKIIGADKAGLVYGIGKFLHTAKWSESNFTPNPPIGVISPACSFRTIYFSVHFYNWYQMAPIEKLERYLEEMLLWGYNTVLSIVPCINLNSYEDQLYKDSVERCKMLFSIAKKIGLKTYTGLAPNQGLKTAPHEFDADLSFDPTGKIRPHIGRNLCPSNPKALEYLKTVWHASLDPFKEIGLDYISLWPYDEGGCWCEDCRPWGAKGFGDVCIAFYNEMKPLFPNAKYLACTWLFDVPEDYGEYAGFYKRLNSDLSWLDYVIIDAHTDYPRYPLEHEVIKPIVNFPEISMWELFPWGGLGANPLPERFQNIWDSSKKILDGGLPYSEGIFEDISKIQFIGYYWEPDRHWRDILAEYINYEFEGDVCEDVLEIMSYIEKNHVLAGNWKEPDLSYALKAVQLAEKVNGALGERAKNCWRWRILYIRAVLDWKRYVYYKEHNMSGRDELFDLKNYHGAMLIEDEEAQNMYKELRKLYHCIDYCEENRWTLPPVNGDTTRGGMTYFEKLAKKKAENKQ